MYWRNYMKITLLLFAMMAMFSGCMTNKSKMNQTANTYEKEYKADLARARVLFKQIEDYSGPKTVDTILKPLNDLDILLDNTGGKASLFYNTHPDKTTRDFAQVCEQEISKLATEISLSRPIYEACLKVDVSNEDSLTRRHHEHLLRDLRRSGIDKPENVRQQIKTLSEELVILGQDFEKNVREDIRSIELTSRDDMNGLPEDYIEAHRPNADGKIIITTDYPDYIPFATYAHNDKLRFDIYKKFRNRGYPANVEILYSILKKRFELAQLLGYRNYAEFITETKMIKNAANAKNFIEKISDVANKRAEEDYQILLSRLKTISPDSTKVGDWQKTYLTELIKQEKYKVDSKDLREYLQYGKVRDGIIDMAGTMFSLKIEKWDTPVWHDSISAYQIKENNKVIARFYLDMHPRENKYKHAAHFGLMSGIRGKQLPISVLVCNFPGEDEETALMEHDQVLTFLHEFGHMMHHLLSGNQDWLTFSGISTEWDFVEAPSQMLEEWIWNADILRRFAVNKQGETIPEELVKKSVAAKNFAVGLDTKHQMFYASMSLDLYNVNPEKLNLDEELKRIQNRYSPYEYVEGTYMYANFAHLYGYSAIYYTYMWSQVIAKDLFSRFENEGLTNPKTALEYRKTILEPGGSKDAADLVKDFLGRPFSFDAYAKWLNRK